LEFAIPNPLQKFIPKETLMKSKPPAKLIGKVLAPAVQLWLRSQVESVEDLQVAISGGNRQILGGYIPQVTLAAHRAVYQGLHFSQLQFAGHHISINLPQVLKGQPLRLLETVTVTGEARLNQEDLQASLSSSLLETAIKEHLLGPIVAGGSDTPHLKALQNCHIAWHRATLEQGRVTFEGIVTNLDRNPKPLRLLAKLELVAHNLLRLYEVQLDASPVIPLLLIEELRIDLGSDVALEWLEVLPGQLCLRGEIAVMP
jgi:hypothetical protein